jgi:hypothetical protein
MSNEQELASLLPTLLRAIADELERDFELAERIARTIQGDSNKKRQKKAAVDFDPFEVLRQGSESALRERLESLEIPALKAIITQHGLDTTRLAQKWRDKDRLVNFIIDRISSRAEKGSVFKAV